MNSTHTVLYDPEGHLEADCPLDRAAHQRLVQSVLTLTDTLDLEPADLQQIALQLTGAARSVADDVRHAAEQLPADHQARALVYVVLEEADRRMSVPLEGTVHCAQGRARLVRALYERLDRLAETTPQPVRAL
ncbi:restriction endonuclease [Streptomyces violascens]|uniref:restriction endonuclease n=1 Tax=Streptomyces violascens TaxID=67381 RepID=UPI0037B8A9FA